MSVLPMNYRELVPPSVKDAIDRHVSEGAPTGDFTCAVLTNNLRMAFGYADDQSLAALQYIVGYCWNDIPSPCWGSKEKVLEWQRKKRAEAIKANLDALPEVSRKAQEMLDG